MRQIGHAANAEYGDKTYTDEDDIRNALTAFGYTSPTSSVFLSSIVKSQIDANKPVYVTGYNSEYEGHAWVIDGYDFTEKSIKYYYATPPYNLWRSSTFTTIYFNCNWGNLVIGDFYLENGLYLASAFEYTENNRIICGITPNI